MKDGKKTYPVVRERIIPFVKREIDQFETMTAARFSLVVGILFILASALITITTNQSILLIPRVGINIIFALNIFIYPLQAFVLKCYVPGLWTTILRIISYNIIFFHELYHQKIFDLTTNLKALVVIILFIPVFIMSHKIAEK